MSEFQSLIRSIESVLFIQCSNYKENYIRRRITSRMRLVHAADFREYKKIFLNDKNEQEKLLNSLTINVTKFYRDPDVFDCILSDVLPDLISHKRWVSIWSAGCSTGEEPYTLAMMAYDLTRHRKDISVRIYATDIDREVLKKAKSGIYHTKALENLSDDYRSRHFTLRGDGTYEIKPHIRDMVQFQTHDLMGSKPIMRNLDMILCRNVTIYFPEKQKNDLARVFHSGLVPGGYYVMGKTEFLGREVAALYDPYNVGQRIFRKN